ncbi:MAG: 4Fe-4S cluster-binding domain-containing protein [Candidatus Saganbacteria bacterium]|nr:4Fe-4S cluster-binding domain-containing protein [Candidatus Saganbacteria bacterium]
MAIGIFKPRVLGIGITRECTSRCRHCAPCSSPATTATLSEKNLRKALESGRKAGIQLIGINGGEPFLKQDLLLNTLEEAKRLDLYPAEVDTNCFFAKDIGSAVRTLKKFENVLPYHGPKELDETIHQTGDINNWLIEKIEPGLLGSIPLQLSVDKFHREYVQIKYVANAIKAIDEVFPQSSFRIGSLLALENLKNFDQSLYLLIRALGIGEDKAIRTDTGLIAGIEGLPLSVEYGLVERFGRARRLFASEFLAAEFSGSNCSAATEIQSMMVPDQLYLDWNGNFVPGYPIFEKNPLPLGNIEDIGADEAIDRANKNPIVRYLMSRGAADFLKKAIEIDPAIAPKIGEQNSVHGAVIEVLNFGMRDILEKKLREFL